MFFRSSSSLGDELGWYPILRLPVSEMRDNEVCHEGLLIRSTFIPTDMITPPNSLGLRNFPERNPNDLYITGQCEMIWLGPGSPSSKALGEEKGLACVLYSKQTGIPGTTTVLVYCRRNLGRGCDSDLLHPKARSGSGANRRAKDAIRASSSHLPVNMRDHCSTAFPTQGN